LSGDFNSVSHAGPGDEGGEEEEETSEADGEPGFMDENAGVEDEAAMPQARRPDNLRKGTLLMMRLCLTTCNLVRAPVQPVWRGLFEQPWT
jgi:hypothetical protein